MNQNNQNRDSKPIRNTVVGHHDLEQAEGVLATLVVGSVSVGAAARAACRLWATRARSVDTWAIWRCRAGVAPGQGMMRMATIVCLVLLAVGCEVPGEGAGDVDFAASQTVEGASTLSAMLPLRTYGIGRVNKGESRGCQVRMTRAGADVSVVIWGQEEPRQAAKELATWVFPARAVCTYEELSIQSVRTAVLKCPQADGQTAKVCVSTLDPNLYVSNNLPLRGNPNALSCSMSVPGLAPGQP